MNSAPKKAFIFDLDGVIVDTAKYHYLAWKTIADALNINFTHEHNELLKGVSRIRSLDIILELGNFQATLEQKELWLAQKNDNYLSYLVNMDSSELLPGVLQTLLFLKEKNQAIVLGSASKNARPILEKTGVLHLFDAVVDGNDVTNAKPDPEVFLIGAQKVNVAPENAFVFEDAVAGIQAANAAKMTSIGIGEASILTEAQYIFKNFNEINTDFIEVLISRK